MRHHSSGNGQLQFLAGDHTSRLRTKSPESLCAQFPIYLQDLKSSTASPNSNLRMRLSLLLLLAAITLVASVNALPIEAATEARSMRSTVDDDAADEERGGFYYKFDFNLLDDIFHSLPEQFKGMRNEPEYLRTIWRVEIGYGNFKRSCPIHEIPRIE
ncbi:hypothetical protein GQ600_25540 [Phytophthora cactorum]|nr:hypothetical protein GQ600_25540 [Phytophthora cactorum]